MANVSSPWNTSSQPLIGRERLGASEAAPVPPLALLHPRARRLVAVKERVRNAPGVDQRPMHVARHGDPDPIVVSVSRKVGSGQQARPRREVPDAEAFASSVRSVDKPRLL